MPKYFGIFKGFKLIRFRHKPKHSKKALPLEIGIFKRRGFYNLELIERQKLKHTGILLPFIKTRF